MQREVYCFGGGLACRGAILGKFSPHLRETLCKRWALFLWTPSCAYVRSGSPIAIPLPACYSREEQETKSESCSYHVWWLSYLTTFVVIWAKQLTVYTNFHVFLLIHLKTNKQKLVWYPTACLLRQKIFSKNLVECYTFRRVRFSLIYRYQKPPFSAPLVFFFYCQFHTGY